MLLKIKNNHFQYFPESDRFISHAPGHGAFTIGTWFKCSEEQTLYLRKEVLAGRAEVVQNLPKVEKLFL